jgi:hypothetical protein
MTENEFNKLVAGMKPVYRIIMAEAAKGPITGPRLRAPTGRSDGMTGELRKLQRLGLIREAGVDDTATTAQKPKMYVKVPLAEVEAEAERYAKVALAEAEAEAKPKRGRNPVQARLASLPKRVEGNRLYAMRVRRNTLLLSQSIQTIDREMVFWDEGTPDEWAYFVYDLGMLMDAVEGLVENLHVRLDDDVIRARLAKLREQNGRTQHEIQAANGLIAKLERQRRATG